MRHEGKIRSVVRNGAPLAALALFACGSPDRDNLADPSLQPDPGIELIGTLPANARDGVNGNQRLAIIQFSVEADDMAEPITGSMNLVGDQATARVLGVSLGAKRVFRIDIFDINKIRTFSTSDTIEVGAGFPQLVLLNLRRLTGALELSSALPPEVVELEVVITTDGGSIVRTIEVEGPLNERIEGIPTGTGIQVALNGRDLDEQIVVERVMQADIRTELVYHLPLSAEIGALAVVANFPGYVPIAEIDRFSDSAGTFYRRSVDPGLPEPNEPVNFDDDFLLRGIGPNTEVIEFYNFDARSAAPAPVYFLRDARGDAIAGQLPVFDQIPGDAGYNDLRLVQQVTIQDRDFRPNSVTSLDDITAAGYEVVSTELIMNCVLVPDGSIATLRFDGDQSRELQDGWYRDQIVKYLLFENPSSSATVEFVRPGEVSTPIMYAFFTNDTDPSEGFAVEDGTTHNVAVRLPAEEGYSPLWALQLFKLVAFDRVISVRSALDQASNDENKLVLAGNAIFHVNAPIVTVTAVGG